MLTLIALFITFIVLARVVAYMMRKGSQREGQAPSTSGPRIILSPELQFPPLEVAAEGESTSLEDEELRVQESNSEVVMSEEAKKALTIESRSQVPEVKVTTDESSPARAKVKAQVDDMPIPAQRRVLRIGNLDVTQKSIAQGIIISEILRRPEF